jgi:hypothetical protein
MRCRESQWEVTGRRLVSFARHPGQAKLLPLKAARRTCLSPHSPLPSAPLPPLSGTSPVTCHQVPSYPSPSLLQHSNNMDMSGDIIVRQRRPPPSFPDSFSSLFSSLVTSLLSTCNTPAAKVSLSATMLMPWYVFNSLRALLRTHLSSGPSHCTGPT